MGMQRKGHPALLRRAVRNPLLTASRCSRRRPPARWPRSRPTTCPRSPVGGAGRDIDERLECGQLDVSAAEAARTERAHLRKRLSRLGHGAPGSDEHAEIDATAAPAPVLAAINAELARSEAGLVLVQLDDLVGQPEVGEPAWYKHRTSELEPLHERHPGTDRRGPGSARSTGTAA